MGDGCSYEVGYALSGKAKCRECQKAIPINQLRIARVITEEFQMKKWYHHKCLDALDEVDDDGEAATADNIAGYNQLKAKDKKIIDKKIGKTSKAKTKAPKAKTSKGKSKEIIVSNGDGPGSFAGYEVGMSKSARAKCSICKNTIPKDVLRCARLVYGDGDYRVPRWHHAHCFKGFNEICEAGDEPFNMDTIKGANALEDDARALVQDILDGKDIPEQIAPEGAKKKAPKKKRKKGEESDDEDEPPKKKKKAAPKKKKKKKDSSWDSEEDSEDMPKKKKKKAPAKKGKGGDTYKGYSVPELKEMLKERSLGYFAKGKKADLMEALAEDDEDDGDAEEPEVEGERKPRTDREFTGGDGYKIYGDYYVKLNQTDIVNDYNKFYILQLLFKEGSYILWLRWGRVGEIGEHIKYEFAKAKPAIKAFEHKFHDKTKNHWKTRDTFVKTDNKYTIVDVEDEEGSDEGEAGTALGKLTEAQIKKGQAVLKRIEEAIEDEVEEDELAGLSSEFYSLIPTDFGRKKAITIKEIDLVREKEELLSFYLRMGFEEIGDVKSEKLTPVSGVMDLPLPKTLMAACKKLGCAADVKNSEKKGVELEKRQAGGPVKHMDSSLYASLMLYTSNAIYGDLNKVLRNEKRSGIKKYFEYLRLFLEAFDHLPPRNATLWRGISVDLFDTMEVGETITWWGVSSTTQEESVARGFLGGCGGNTTLFRLDTKTACDISQMSFFASEKESLLAPGTQLKCLSKKRNGKIAEIHLEEVGRCVS